MPASIEAGILVFMDMATGRRQQLVTFHLVGDAAGEIWRLLKLEGPLSIPAIVGKTRRPKTLVYMGIGWLAREDKLLFTHTKNGLTLSLKK